MKLEKIHPSSRSICCATTCMLPGLYAIEGFESWGLCRYHAVQLTELQMPPSEFEVVPTKIGGRFKIMWGGIRIYLPVADDMEGEFTQEQAEKIVGFLEELS